VTSTQDAKITIDDEDMGRMTPFTFVVSPGDHYVSLPSLPKCMQPKKVAVSSGSTNSANCDAATGWSR
jgi:hypothetical protein